MYNILSFISEKISRNYQFRFWIKELNSLWIRDGFKASIVDIKDETKDVKTFHLKPGNGWSGFIAGQYVNICIEVNGVRMRRCYSLTSDPKDKDTFSVTVKRIGDGKVSGWMHQHLRIGDIIELGHPTGEFTLDEADYNGKLLFVMGGSGVTPGISIIKDLRSKESKADIVFIQACKTRDDILFKAELDKYSKINPGLKVVYYVESEDGFLTCDGLEKLVPDLKDRKAFMCGPNAMMESLRPAWDGFRELLKTEVFVNSFVKKVEGSESVAVKLTRSNRLIQVKKGSLILDELERSGISHPYGCRMGVCNTCSCVKIQGETEKVTSGEVSAEAGVRIKPCVSIANSDIELDV